MLPQTPLTRTTGQLPMSQLCCVATQAYPPARMPVQVIERSP
jgi:hypothetical protein